MQYRPKITVSGASSFASLVSMKIELEEIKPMNTPGRSDSDTDKIRPSICPMCGRNNVCVMAQANESDSVNAQRNECWCMSESFPKNYQSYLTDKDLDTRCICKACLERIRITNS